MDRRINIRYYSNDELWDMLRDEVELVRHTRGKMIRALEELTGMEYDDDRYGLDNEDDQEDMMD